MNRFWILTKLLQQLINDTLVKSFPAANFRPNLPHTRTLSGHVQIVNIFIVLKTTTQAKRFQKFFPEWMVHFDNKDPLTEINMYKNERCINSLLGH